MDEKLLNSFVADLSKVSWLSHAGEPFKPLRTVESLQAGWDSEGRQMLTIWEPQTHILETQARISLDEAGIDHVFSTISNAIHDSLYNGICRCINKIYANNADEAGRQQRSVDESLYSEVMDSIKRDVCWAAVEYLLQVDGFFSGLLCLYRKGRWPCSWDGQFPEGQPVVF